MPNFFTNLLNGVVGRIKNTFDSPYKKAGLNWFSIKYLKHLPYGKPGIYHLNGIKIHYHNGPELFHSLVEIFVEDIYDISFSHPRPYILDCGANIGLASIYLKRKYPEAIIVAFEPDANNFGLLSKNINQMNWKDIEIRQEAIWKEDCLLDFSSDGTLGSKIATSAPTQTGNTQAIRLKNLLNRKIDFLKLDIEGAETEVLRDCASELSCIEHLFIEFHGHFNKMQELNDVLQLVTAAGFSYYIKEATSVYATPFNRSDRKMMYDLQLNIFCFKTKTN